MPPSLDYTISIYLTNLTVKSEYQAAAPRYLHGNGWVASYSITFNVGVVKGHPCKGVSETVKPPKFSRETVPLNFAKTVIASFHALYLSHWLLVAEEALIIDFAIQNNRKLIPLPVIC